MFITNKINKNDVSWDSTSSTVYGEFQFLPLNGSMVIRDTICFGCWWVFEITDDVVCSSVGERFIRGTMYKLSGGWTDIRHHVQTVRWVPCTNCPVGIRHHVQTVRWVTWYPAPCTNCPVGVQTMYKLSGGWRHHVQTVRWVNWFNRVLQTDKLNRHYATFRIKTLNGTKRICDFLIWFLNRHNKKDQCIFNIILSIIFK